jgi:four helix bundle protein
LSKQLLRSGNSIGTKKDFLSKISISYKEARETIYWLKLQQATEHISDQEAISLLNDAEEICRILGKIQITIKTRNS